MTIEEAKAQVAKAKRDLKRAERKLKVAIKEDKVNQLKKFFENNAQNDILVEFNDGYYGSFDDKYVTVKGYQVQVYKNDNNAIVVEVPRDFICALECIKSFKVIIEVMEVEQN